MSRPWKCMKKKSRINHQYIFSLIWFSSTSLSSFTEFNFDFSLIPGSVPDPLSQQLFGVLPPVFQWCIFLFAFVVEFVGEKNKHLISRVEDWFPGIPVSQAWRLFFSIHPGLRPWQYDGDPNLWSHSGKFTRSRSNKTTSPIRVSNPCGFLPTSLIANQTGVSIVIIHEALINEWIKRNQSKFMHTYTYLWIDHMCNIWYTS